MFQPPDRLLRYGLVCLNHHHSTPAPAIPVQRHIRYVHRLVGQHGSHLTDMSWLVQIMDNQGGHLTTAIDVYSIHLVDHDPAPTQGTGLDR